METAFFYYASVNVHVASRKGCGDGNHYIDAKHENLSVAPRMGRGDGNGPNDVQRAVK